MKALLRNKLRDGVLVLCLFLASAQLNGQDKKPCTAGIYNTQQDLVNNRISNKINTGDDGYKFSFQFPADLKLTIKIVTPDTTMLFKPGSVYGYHECGRAFRYYSGGDLLAQEDYYRIEEMGGLVIYSSVFISGSELFYSRDLSSAIHRLQVNYLEKDFADHPDFIKAVKQLKKKGVDGITDHDDKGHFVVNRIYSEKIGKK
jgi:hypothetical protein